MPKSVSLALVCRSNNATNLGSIESMRNKIATETTQRVKYKYGSLDI